MASAAGTNLELKLGQTTIGPEKLPNLTAVCRFIAELANLPLRRDQAFVGHSAFAHQGGIHVSAVLKDSSTYEHISPEAVVDAIRLELMRLTEKDESIEKAVEENCWGV